MKPAATTLYRALVFTTWLAACPVHGQRNAAHLDSLADVLTQAAQPGERLSAARDLARQCFESDPQRALDIAVQGIRLLDSLQQANALPDSTDADYRISFLHYETIAYGNLGDVDAELRTALERLKFTQQRGEPPRESAALTAIGNIYLDQGYHEEARGYYRRAMAIEKEMGDTLGLAIGIGNLVNTFGYDHPDTNLFYYHRSLDLIQRTHRRQTAATAAWMMQNIGAIHEVKGDLDTALFYYTRSLAIRDSIGHRLGQYHAHKVIADVLMKEGRTREALQHIDASIRIAEQNGFHDNYESYATRASIRARLGRYREALDDHRRYLDLRDSIVNAGNTKQVVQQAMRYEYGRKLLADSLAHEKERAVQALDNELAQERIRRTRNIYLFAGLGVLLLAGGLWSRLRYTHRAKVAIEKEKQVSEDLLHNILPEEVADELKAKGEAEAKHIDQVTVLFTDFKGFTAMSEKLSPKELVKDIHECFSAFDKIIEKHGIEKIKTIGDAYMAAGGLPVPNTTHASDAIAAAMEMRDFIAEGKARKIAAGLPFFEIRIGIHTGPVVAGIVGVKKFQYDIWGDTVNTASRMESSGAPGHVNISEATYALVKDQPDLTFTPRGKVQAKGKGEMEMFFVRRSSEGA
ncbi:MAG: tetratricopeptide repeat protein [Flavobacteriales bacterium]|nr:tetratricopeptide repeat protein [Flavobacteriales bacterium]MCB9166223.1 tetratricopeptide repeat protein [Flavobacteriales bacterium]